jgi:hypothetical protein
MCTVYCNYENVIRSNYDNCTYGYFFYHIALYSCLLLCIVFVIFVVYCFECVCVILCIVLYCIVLCIVVSLPPGTYPLAVNINNNNKYFIQ